MHSSKLALTRCGVLLAAIVGQGAHASAAFDRTSFAATVRMEAVKAGLPFDIADAVMAVESGYDPTRIGGVGEIGLMQIRPATAAMLGFKGSAAELARPDTNIHFGVAYLAEAWRRADGNLCRALMKYRAGHGEEAMSPLSVSYCERARTHLAEVGSRFAQGLVMPAVTGGSLSRAMSRGGTGRNPLIGMDSETFWAAHTARIKRLDAQVQRRWRRIASR